MSLPSIHQHKQVSTSKFRRSAADPLIRQLLKFRIEGQTINARNVDELYPGLDRLLIRCLQTGDCRQLNNRLQRNLKAEYLLITGKHIHISVCAQTQDILERLVNLGATLGKRISSTVRRTNSSDLDLHFYEPIHMKELELLCKYGFDINERLPKYNNQTPLSIFINKRYSIAMLRVLIEHGARFDLKDNQGQTSLHHVCQPNISDDVFDYIVEQTPDECLNLTNQSGGTALDLLFFSTYENPSLARMRRLHVLLVRKASRLTRYGMREPNLHVRKQYRLTDVLSCKEFLFKYRLKEIFHPTVRPFAWCLFLVFDVVRACEHQDKKIQQRLERYLISMIENGEILSNQFNFHSSSQLDDDQQRLLDAEKSLLSMSHLQMKLNELRSKTLTLKALCRIKIKQEIRTFPNDVIHLHSLSKILQSYLTFYNPFIKSDVNDPH